MKWISVSDGLPNDIGVVLVWTKTGLYDVASYIKTFEFWQLSIGMQDEDVTHWAYLPEPPKEKV